MSDQKKNPVADKTESVVFGRRDALELLGGGLLIPLVACGRGDKKMQNYAVMDIEMFSYIDRAVGDIMFNGTDLGVMNKYGGTGLITGVRIPFGVQTLTWMLDGPKGTPRNGEIVKVKNALVIAPEQIPLGSQFLGLHLYPEDTAEIIFSESMPERTARGRKILAARK